MSNVTVLTHTVLSLAKTWQANGTLEKYPHAKTFDCSSRPVGGVRELSALLSELEATPRAAIIRGELREGIRPKGVCRNNDTFEDVPRPWLALDVDEFEPKGIDPVTAPAGAVAEFLATQLPEFESAAYHWQLTGSAGHPSAAGKLKARVWFWLEEPRTSRQLKAWAKGRWPDGAPFDASIFGATQIHYTAAPVMGGGVEDPVPVRSGFTDGKATAHVPYVEEATPEKGERLPVGEVSDAYTRRTLAGIYQDIEEAPLGERNGVLYQKARRAFSLVHACQGDGAEVRVELEAAASISGLDAEEIGETLDSAWSASQKEPDDVAPPSGATFEGERPPVGEDSLTLSPESPQEAAQEHSGGRGGSALGFTLVGDLVANLKPIAWQVRGFLEADSLGLIYGPPKSGKSFLAIDWACCVATGTPWNGHEVQQGAVFYLAGEGHNGLARRFSAWEKAKGVPLAGAPLAVSHKAAPLTDRDAATKVLHAIAELAEQTGQAPAVIVVDTLARNFGADENSTEDMGRFVQHLDEIRANWKCTVLVVHHTGKDEGKGARGNSSLTGAIDAGYLVKRDATGSVTFEPTEMKDAELPPPISFTLEGVKVWVGEDGNDVFGAHLVPGGAPASPTRGRKGKNQTRALAELGKLALEQEAEVLRAGGTPGPVWVDLEEWRQACRKAGVDRRRWSDVLRSLEETGDVHVDGQHVRLSDAALGASPQRQPVGGKDTSSSGREITTPFYPSQGAGCPVLSAPLGGADRTGHRQDTPTGQTGVKPDTNRTPPVKPSFSLPVEFGAEEPPAGWNPPTGRRRKAGGQPAGGGTPASPTRGRLENHPLL